MIKGDLVRKQTLTGNVAISGSVVVKDEQEKSIDIVENGEYSVTPDSNKTLSEVNISVNIPSDAKEEQEKTLDVKTNGKHEVEPDNGKVLSKVTVNVDVDNGGVDTSDATVTADDLAKDVVAYGEGGKRVVGSVSTFESGSVATTLVQEVTEDSYRFGFETTLNQSALFRDGSSIQLRMDKTSFGNATASDVVKGKTFTSSNGLNVEGTHVDKEEQTKKAKYTGNGTYTITPDSGKTLSSASIEVEVPSDAKEEEVKNVEYTTNGSKTITPSSGKAISQVNVQVNVQPKLQEKSTNKNGDVVADSGYDGLSKVSVNVPEKVPTLQDKTITENGTYSADNGYDGLGNVTVNVESEGGIDTSDATVTENDMPQGVTAYGKEGVKITGVLPVEKGKTCSNVNDVSFVNNSIRVYKNKAFEQRTVMETNSYVAMHVPSSNFGNATASDVANGKTFTSADGYKVVGTHIDKEEQTKNAKYEGNGKYTITPDNEKTLSSVIVEVAVPSDAKEEEEKNVEYTTNGDKVITPTDGKVISKVNVKVNVPQLDTSDATATASDLAEGKTSYANGKKMTGSVPVVNSGSNASGTFGGFNTSTSGKLGVNIKTESDKLLRGNSGLSTEIEYSQFGTATASDVAKGKTFTSSDGLQVVGTHECSGGGGVDTSDATVTAEDMAKAVVAYGKDGQRVVGNVTTFESGSVVSTLAQELTDDGRKYSFRTTLTTGALLRPGCVLSLEKYKSDFGTATADKVLEGETFTSADGLKQTGTMKASSGVTLPDGAVVIQKVIGAEASTQVGSGYSLSITYGSDVEINDSLALEFVGSTQPLGSISDSTNFSVLQGKYIRSGSGTTGKYYYIPDGSTFTVGGSNYSKTLTCDRAQSVTIQKVTV